MKKKQEQIILKHKFKRQEFTIKATSYDVQVFYKSHIILHTPPPPESSLFSDLKDLKTEDQFYQYAENMVSKIIKNDFSKLPYTSNMILNKIVKCY